MADRFCWWEILKRSSLWGGTTRRGEDNYYWKQKEKVRLHSDEAKDQSFSKTGDELTWHTPFGNAFLRACTEGSFVSFLFSPLYFFSLKIGATAAVLCYIELIGSRVQSFWTNTLGVDEKNVYAERHCKRNQRFCTQIIGSVQERGSAQWRLREQHMFVALFSKLSHSDPLPWPILATGCSRHCDARWQQRGKLYHNAPMHHTFRDSSNYFCFFLRGFKAGARKSSCKKREDAGRLKTTCQSKKIY